jgi:hypothetical protein
MSMLLFLQYALWSIIGDSSFVVSSLVSSASAFFVPVDRENGNAPSLDGTGSVSCNSAFVLHLCRFLNHEDLMEREAMVQNP